MKNIFAFLSFIIILHATVLHSAPLGHFVFNSSYNVFDGAEKLTPDGRACLPIYIGMFNDGELSIPIYAVFESHKDGILPMESWSLPIVNSTLTFIDNDLLEVILPNGNRLLMKKGRDDIYFTISVPVSSNTIFVDAKKYTASMKPGNIIELENKLGWRLTFKKGMLQKIQCENTTWIFSYSSVESSIKKNGTKVFSVLKKKDNLILKAQDKKFVLECDYIGKHGFNLIKTSGDCEQYVFEKHANSIVYSHNESASQMLEWNKDGILTGDESSNYKIDFFDGAGTKIKNVSRYVRSTNTTYLMSLMNDSRSSEMYKNGKIVYSVDIMPAFGNLIRKLRYIDILNGHELLTKYFFYDGDGNLIRTKTTGNNGTKEVSYDNDVIKK